MADTTFYLYCGDMQKNVYFISDNLKDEFNFTDNLVYNFVDLLEQRIYKPDQALHIADLQDMIKRNARSIRSATDIYNKAGAVAVDPLPRHYEVGRGNGPPALLFR